MKSISPQLSVPDDRVESEVRSANQQVNRGASLNHYYEGYTRPDNLLMLPGSFQSKVVRRFVVLVPTESFSTVDYSYEIGRYILPDTSLMFMARVTKLDQELIVRRELILLEIMFRSRHPKVQSRLVTNLAWKDALKEIWQEGDLIICLEDHKVQHFLVWSISLGKKIFSELRVPVLLYQDIHVWGRTPFQKAARELAAWALVIGTILLFTMFLIQIDRSITGWMGRVFICLTVIVEGFLIWKINDIFN